MDSDVPSSDKKAPPKRQTAVAIENDLNNPLQLPVITAAGHGAVAEKIMQIAFEKGIKVRQDADLAELLATLELDHEIPTEAIIAVAEILIQVYKANGTLPWDYTPDYKKLKKSVAAIEASEKKIARLNETPDINDPEDNTV